MLDLYPTEDEEYAKLLTWGTDAFRAADNAREPNAEKWRRFYKLFRSYVRRKPGDWRSKVFMPEVFQQIQTILPSLVTTLPTFTANPVGPEDVRTAKVMERLINWASDKSQLHVELVKGYLDTLIFGTGILKTFPDTQYAYGSEIVPEFQTEAQLIREPLIDPETQRQMIALDGNPMFDEREVDQEVLVGHKPQKKRYVAYDGPAARCIDLFNFWVAPEAEDIETARFVVHRIYRQFSDIKRLCDEGIYRWPEELSESDFWANDLPNLERLDSIERGGGSDATRRFVELLEFWIKDGPDDPGRVLTIANRKAILRHHENPFWHGQKPFIRMTDYLVAHEFWGIGEIEAVEGIQDAINALTNQRIDNGRLTMDQGWAVVTQALQDPRDLVRRPGQTIRLKSDGYKVDEVIGPLPSGEVPHNAFVEVQNLQSMMERATGASSYQQGIDTPAQADTATGAAMMHEAGRNRFGLKATLFEIGPLKTLGLHYGSLLQQFTTTERVVRMLGPEGQAEWESIDPAALQGQLDYSVESSSAQQSETVKRQQAMEVFREVAQVVPMGVLPPEAIRLAFKDLLEAMGAKSLLRFFEEQPQLMAGPPMPEQPPMGMGMQ